MRIAWIVMLAALLFCGGCSNLTKEELHDLQVTEAQKDAAWFADEKAWQVTRWPAPNVKSLMGQTDGCLQVDVNQGGFPPYKTFFFPPGHPDLETAASLEPKDTFVLEKVPCQIEDMEEETLAYLHIKKVERAK